MHCRRGAIDPGQPWWRPAGAGDGAGALVEWRGGAAVAEGEDPFRSLAGAAGLRMALAAKVVRAHGGEVSSEGGRIRARLPLQK
jgi:hypothetical protein